MYLVVYYYIYYYLEINLYYKTGIYIIITTKHLLRYKEVRREQVQSNVFILKLKFKSVNTEQD